MFRWVHLVRIVPRRRGQRRNVQPVKMQVCLLCELIVKSYSQPVASPQAPDRGHVLPVVGNWWPAMV